MGPCALLLFVMLGDPFQLGQLLEGIVFRYPAPKVQHFEAARKRASANLLPIRRTRAPQPPAEPSGPRSLPAGASPPVRAAGIPD